MIKLKQKMFGKNDGLILDVDFNNNFTNKVSGGVQLVAGNGNGLPSFLDNSVNFDGIKTLKTNGNLLINSDKLTISFNMKTSYSNVAYLLYSGSTPFLGNTFGSLINDQSQSLSSVDSNQGLDIRVTPLTSGVWVNYIILIDRNIDGVTRNKILKNKVENYSIDRGYLNYNKGNFASNILYLGTNHAGEYPIIGQLKNLKIWNRILTQTEINNL